MAEQKLR